jgi:predicted ester cyclase
MNPEVVLVEIAAAVNRGDLDSIRERFGNERLTASYRMLLSAFPDASIEVGWTIVQDDRAAGWATIRGTHRGEWHGLPATGRPIDVQGMIAVKVAADGTVEDFWVATDLLSVAMQIGVPLALTED